MAKEQNDGWERSRHVLVADFDLTADQLLVPLTQIIEPSWAVGVTFAHFVYSVEGTGGTNVSFEGEGKPRDALSYPATPLIDANTITPGTTLYSANLEKAQQIRVTWSATVGTWTGVSTLKVWAVT